MLKTLKKLKDDNEADEDEVDDGKGPDEDEISNMKDSLAQKSAEQWVKRYIKELCDGHEAIISYLWKEACTYTKIYLIPIMLVK